MLLLVQPQLVEGVEGVGECPLVIVCQISYCFKARSGLALQSLELYTIEQEGPVVNILVKTWITNTGPTLLPS